MIWSVPLILLNLSSAFDTIDHQILLSILSRHSNITGTALTWFETYLPVVQIHSVMVMTQQLTTFLISQGSVLGTQQFRTYTSDISSVCMRHTVRFHLYANDRQAYASGHLSDVYNICCRLSECASNIAAWCAFCRLQLNSAKTEAIWFGSHANLSKLTTWPFSHSQQWQHFSCFYSQRPRQYTRRRVDDELNMNQHVNSIAKTCFSVCARFAVALDMMSQCDLCLQ